MSSIMLSLTHLPAMAQITTGRLLGGTAVVLAVLGLGHLAATWAEKRGFIHYRQGRGGGVAMSGAMSVLEQIFNPASEHRIEYEEEEHGEPTESGRGTFILEDGSQWRAPED